MDVSERRACRALGQHRSTQPKVPRGRDDEEALTADLVALAEKYGRYGYRKISALMKAAGQAAQARPDLGQRRLLHPSSPGIPQSRVVVRLRRGAHA